MSDSNTVLLNPEQELAANHRDGPCLVTAAPGSGKTRTVIERTARLIDSGIDASSILSITFTNRAAKELVDRLKTRLGDKAKGLTACTIHSWCARCLRRYGHQLGYGPGFTILDADDQIDVLAQTARQTGFEWKRPIIKKIAAVMDDCREKLLPDDEMETVLNKADGDWNTVVRAYLQRLRDKDMIDFSGLLTETVRLLQEKPDTLKAIQERFSYIQVDEAQDTNIAQWSIAERLAGTASRNLTVVADTDQSIYKFRGAEPGNILKFIRDFNPKIIRLGLNYRSTPQIVSVADKLIRHNPNRPADDFRTDNADGPPVECLRFNTSDDEAKWVAQQARIAIARGTPAREIAVLYRVNKLSRAVEIAMQRERVLAITLGGFSFFDRSETKDIMATLRFLNNPHDGLSFHRIANKPARGLGNVSIGKLESFADAQRITLLEACTRGAQVVKTADGQTGAASFAEAFNFDWKSLPLAQALRTLLDRLHYDRWIAEDDAEKIVDRRENVEEMIAYAADFTAGGGTLTGFLDHLALMSTHDKAKDKDAVSLSSAHNSKGLEWSLVMVIGVEERLWPHALDQTAEDIEESRRLLYVGASRAKHRLCLSYCTQRTNAYAAGRGQQQYDKCQPSRFLYEMGLLKAPTDKVPVPVAKPMVDEYAQEGR